MTGHEVAELVREGLSRQRNGGIRIDVIEEGVRQDGDWWHVPVKPENEPPRTYAYYDTLATVEEEITESNHLNILLVPSG